MVYVIAEPCIDVKDKACVEVCPVDCIYEGPNQLLIHPDECIGLRVYTSLHTGNGQLAATQPSAAGRRTEPPPDAGQARDSSGSEPGRPRTSARADSTRASGGPSKDPNTPSAAKETDAPTGGSRLIHKVHGGPAACQSAQVLAPGPSA